MRRPFASLSALHRAVPSMPIWQRICIGAAEHLTTQSNLLVFLRCALSVVFLSLLAHYVTLPNLPSRERRINPPGRGPGPCAPVTGGRLRSALAGPPVPTSSFLHGALVRSLFLAAAAEDGGGVAGVSARAVATTAAARRNFSVCVFPSNVHHSHIASHAAFALEYYSTGGGAASVGARYGLTAHDWHVRVLGDGTLTPKAYVTSWVLHGARCDGLVGPGYSSLANVLSPLVDGGMTAWVDPSSTATELSNPEAAFSRILLNDEAAVVRASTAVFKAFGWAHVNVLCQDDAYGRSLASGMSAAMRILNGTVPQSRCLHKSTTDRDVVRKALLSFLDETPTRVVFIAMFQSDLFHMTIDIIKEERLDERMLILFSEAACTTVTVGYARLRSALCYSYTTNATFGAPYIDAYKARDTTAIRAKFESLPHWAQSSPAFNYTDTSILGYAAHDAALHTMHSLVAALESNKTRVVSVRGSVTQGTTGMIRLDPSTGDRLAAELVIFNALGNGTHSAIAYVSEDSVTFVNQEKGVLLLGKQSTVIPPDVVPQPAMSSSSSKLTMVLIGAIAGPLVLFLIVCASLLAVYLATRGQATRNDKHAPKDSTKPFAIVFTDIQASTALWARVPEQMSEAVDVHHATIRRLIARHHGYEVKTIGDSFMVAFLSAKDAVAFSLALHTALHVAEWDAAIDSTYRELTREGVVSTAVTGKVAYGEAWNGLRVRVGAHYGLGKIQQDPVTQGFDYYGTVVNTAARVEAVGHGGQTLVTGAMVTAAEVDCFAGVSILSLGPQTLRGLSDTVPVAQVLPIQFSVRRFPPLRLTVEIHDDFSALLTEPLDDGTTPDPDAKDAVATLGDDKPHQDRKALRRSTATFFGMLYYIAGRTARHRAQAVLSKLRTSQSMDHRNGRSHLSHSLPKEKTSPPKSTFTFTSASNPLGSAAATAAFAMPSHRRPPQGAVGLSPAARAMDRTRASGLSVSSTDSDTSGRFRAKPSRPPKPAHRGSTNTRAFAVEEITTRRSTSALSIDDDAVVPIASESTEETTAQSVTPVAKPRVSVIPDAVHSNASSARRQASEPPSGLSPASDDAYTTVFKRERDALYLLSVFVTKMLATLTDEERQRALSTLGRRWHVVDEAAKLHGLSDPRAKAQLIAGLCERVWASLDDTMARSAKTSAKTKCPLPELHELASLAPLEGLMSLSVNEVSARTAESADSRVSAPPQFSSFPPVPQPSLFGVGPSTGGGTHLPPPDVTHMEDV